MKSHRKFSRTSAHRRALFRNLATSLILSGRCKTSIEKAKDLRSVVEKLITKARVGTLAARRGAYAYLMDKSAVHKLFAEIAPKYDKRPGGYTRVVRLGTRHGDAAEMAIIEFVPEEKKTKAKKPRASRARSSKKQPANESSASEEASA